jgi:hypothetical protein
MTVKFLPRAQPIESLQSVEPILRLGKKQIKKRMAKNPPPFRARREKKKKKKPALGRMLSRLPIDWGDDFYSVLL